MTTSESRVSEPPAVFSAAPCQLLRGADVADEILGPVARDVVLLKEADLCPRLVSLIFGDPRAGEIYVRNQRRVAERVGVEFVEVALSATIAEAEALAAIERLDRDIAVTGIILQRPVPAHLSVKRLQGAITPGKDVEGMHPDSIGQIVYGLSGIGPCTALAAVELLRRTGLKIPGLEVVVIGHSEIVGKPLAFLLMAEGATVTVCHHMTRSVGMHSRRADAVFVAVGKAHLVGATMIKPGAAVIDIGMNSVVDPSGTWRVVGDVDAEAAMSVAGWLTPVPGGVGPVTLSILMRNVVHAARQQLERRTLSKPAPRASDAQSDLDRVLIRDLNVSGRVGVHDHESIASQDLRVNIDMRTRRGGGGLGVVNYQTVAEKVRRFVGQGHVRLVEELAESLASLCLEDSRVRRVTVQVEKLQAVQGAGGVGVAIVRNATQSEEC